MTCPLHFSARMLCWNPLLRMEMVVSVLDIFQSVSWEVLSLQILSPAQVETQDETQSKPVLMHFLICFRYKNYYYNFFVCVCARHFFVSAQNFWLENLIGFEAFKTLLSPLSMLWICLGCQKCGELNGVLASKCSTLTHCVLGIMWLKST